MRELLAVGVNIHTLMRMKRKKELKAKKFSLGLARVHHHRIGEKFSLNQISCSFAMKEAI